MVEIGGDRCREAGADGPDKPATRVAEGRRGRRVAKKPSAVAGTARSGRFEGRSGSERRTERGSAKTVASRPGIGYPIGCVLTFGQPLSRPGARTEGDLS